MPLSRPLSQSTIVITGASGGIGAATARALAGRGASVVLAARGTDALGRVAEDCRAAGGRALAVPTDVTDPAAVADLATRAAASAGRIDGWVNNATEAAYGLLGDVPPEEFRRVVEVNLLGTAYGMRAALPHLRAAGGGVIVNNASVLAEVTMPYMSSYNAAKHGVRGLSDTVRQELRHEPWGRRISVCTVLPATIDTPFFAHAANHSGREPTPPPPVYPPGVVARAIVRMLEHPRRETYAGLAAALLGYQWRLMPGITERVLGAYGARTAVGRRGAPDTTGNLTGSRATGEERGGWHGRTRMLLRAGAATGLAVGAAAILTARRRAR
ncbi:SDR family oxidoreductase [Catenuloplanes atrovinosus]|uniref:NAD(P)-dependent dehydrogenase (Short-subunit alcohol dehydrogenase family) n=1 Tax=Catenuloplanes atrovinosus TaxID=137266 RepID=A0AAE3YYB3_9ACTN|nr:SDR family oxidoreductase [Catenuloplanes atrovinosus]MDR7280937.1 NAD(P)-dependent dehydrogenase (short-subunit alcohol dehydrogenase family) [Catenuloplanes atrovinosus]